MGGGRGGEYECERDPLTLIPSSVLSLVLDASADLTRLAESPLEITLSYYWCCCDVACTQTRANHPQCQ